MSFSRLLLFLCISTTGWAADKPNVLFIAIDDLAPALRCYGNLIAKTPHIDHLATCGVRDSPPVEYLGACQKCNQCQRMQIPYLGTGMLHAAACAHEGTGVMAMLGTFSGLLPH